MEEHIGRYWIKIIRVNFFFVDLVYKKLHVVYLFSVLLDRTSHKELSDMNLEVKYVM